MRIPQLLAGANEYNHFIACSLDMHPAAVIFSDYLSTNPPLEHITLLGSVAKSTPEPVSSSNTTGDYVGGTQAAVAPILSGHAEGLTAFDSGAPPLINGGFGERGALAFSYALRVNTILKSLV